MTDAGLKLSGVWTCHRVWGHRAGHWYWAGRVGRAPGDGSQPRRRTDRADEHDRGLRVLRVHRHLCAGRGVHHSIRLLGAAARQKGAAAWKASDSTQVHDLAAAELCHPVLAAAAVSLPAAPSDFETTSPLGPDQCEPAPGRGGDPAAARPDPSRLSGEDGAGSPGKPGHRGAATHMGEKLKDEIVADAHQRGRAMSTAPGRDHERARAGRLGAAGPGGGPGAARGGAGCRDVRRRRLQPATVDDFVAQSRDVA